MTIPDFTHLNAGDIAGLLVGLAVAVFLVGMLRAATSATILWTYVKDWLVSWLGPALVLVALAVIGQGIGPIKPNQIVQVAFVPAAASYVVAAAASLAKNLGADLSRLPRSKNVRAVFDAAAVRDGASPNQ